MRQECIDAVSQAIGGPLTHKEVQGIEDKLATAMKMIARKDPDGCSRCPEQDYRVHRNKGAMAASLMQKRQGPLSAALCLSGNNLFQLLNCTIINGFIDSHRII